MSSIRGLTIGASLLLVGLVTSGMPWADEGADLKAAVKENTSPPVDLTPEIFSEYTAETLRRGFEGLIYVQLVIGSDGLVLDVKPIGSATAPYAGSLKNC